MARSLDAGAAPLQRTLTRREPARTTTLALTVTDAATWTAIVRGPIAPTVEDASLLHAATDALPAEPWDGGTWKAWTSAVGAATGKKGRALFHPLRLALTGREQGPEMAGMLPLIGRAKVLSRLRGDVA